MKKVVAMLLVICLLGVAALSDISGIGIVKADEQQDTKLKQISFDDFGISDGDIIGWTAMAGTNTTFEDVVFNGWITLHGDCNRTMLLGNGWNGLQLNFWGDSIRVAANSVGGGTWYIYPRDVGMGTFEDVKFKLSISLEKVSETDAVMKISISDKEIKLDGAVSQTLSGAYAAETGNLNNVALYFADASEEYPITVNSYVELKELTFSNFGMQNTDITGWSANAGVDTTLENVIFKGYFNFHNRQDRNLLLGNGWNGLQLNFWDGSIRVVAANVGGGVWYVYPQDVGMTTFENVTFKLSIALEKKNDDAILQLYINDRTVLLDGSESQVLTGAYADGTGNLNNAALYLSDADAEHPISIASVAKLKEVTFENFGMQNMDVTGWSANAGVDTTLENISFSGNVEFKGRLDRIFLLGNGWNGIRLDFKGSSIEGLLTGVGGANFGVIPKDMGMTTFEDILFELTISLEKIGETDAIFRLYINNMPVMMNGAYSQVLTGVYTAETGNLNNVALYWSNADAEHPITISSIDNGSDKDDSGNDEDDSNEGGSEVEIVKPKLTEISFKQLGIVDGLYSYANGQLVVSGSSQQSLMNTTVTQKITFSEHTNNWFHYAAKENPWFGIRFITDVNSGNIIIIPTTGEFTETYVLDSKIAGTKLLGEEIELTLELFSVGEDAYLGVIIGDNLYNNQYFKLTGAAQKLGGLVSFYVENEEGYVQLGMPQPTPTINKDFKKLTFDSYEIETGTYKIKYSPDTEGKLQPDASASGTCRLANMDGVVFSDIVNFSKEAGAQLRIFGKESMWHGLVIETLGNGKLQILDASGVFAPIVLDSETAGVALNGRDIEMTLSVEFVDSDDDGKKDDVKLGIWFDGKSYDNKWFYLRDSAKNIGPYALIFCPNEKTSFSLQTDWVQIDFGEFGFTTNWFKELGLKLKNIF